MEGLEGLEGFLLIYRRIFFFYLYKLITYIDNNIIGGPPVVWVSNPTLTLPPFHKPKKQYFLVLIKNWLEGFIS